MKRNTGFTLIELLAVITIIALILVIAIPNIMNMSNRMKDRGLTSKIDAIEKATVNHIQNKSNDIKKSYGVCDNTKASETWCTCETLHTGSYTRERCQYSFTMTVKGLIEEGAITPDDENGDGKCLVSDPTNNDKCLDCAVIVIRLDGDYKTVTASLKRDTISESTSCSS